jgi:hypothetical protein
LCRFHRFVRAIHTRRQLVSPNLPRDGGEHHTRKRAEKPSHASIHERVNHVEDPAAQHVPGGGAQAGNEHAIHVGFRLQVFSMKDVEAA